MAFLCTSYLSISCIWFVFEIFGFDLHPWLGTSIVYVVPILTGYVVSKIFTNYLNFKVFSLSRSMGFIPDSSFFGKTTSKIQLDFSHIEEGSGDDHKPSEDHKSVVFDRILRNPFLTELYIRPIYQKGSILEHDILFYRSFVDFAIEKFPTSVHVYLCKSIFELCYGKDPITSLSIVNQVTQLEIDLRLDYDFFFFQSKKMADNLRREQSTGQSLDSSSFLVLQRQLKTAIDLHKDCLDYLSVFWKQLLVEDQSQITLTNLPVIAERIYQSKTEAESYFTKLLRQHPGNKEVLEAYSKFVREINLDDEFADSLLTQMELADSDRQSSSGGQSTVDPSVTGKSITSARNKKRKSKRRRKGQSILLHLGGDKSSENASSAEKLRVSVHIALIILIVICIVSFVQFLIDVHSISEQFSYLFEADHYGGALQDVTVQSFLLSNSMMGHNFNTSIHDLRLRLISEAEHAMFHLRRLLISSAIAPTVTNLFDCIGDVSDIPPLSSHEVLNQLTTPSIFRESLSVSFPHVTQSEIVSLWELSFDYCRRAFLFGRNETERTIPDLDSHRSDVFFLVQNREQIYDRVLGFLTALKDDVLDQLDLIVVINIVSNYCISCYCRCYWSFPVWTCSTRNYSK
ncbi:hypothetical protein GEMRC1_006624 [Eukaryota sp. GEM-RC1]